jgi:flagellar biogenesis protein FliO
MTPERFVYYVLGLLAIVLAVFLLIWLVDRLDDETTESVVRGVDVALGRGWDRLGGRAS